MATGECALCGSMGNFTKCPKCGSNHIMYDETFSEFDDPEAEEEKDDEENEG